MTYSICKEKRAYFAHVVTSHSGNTRKLWDEIKKLNIYSQPSKALSANITGIGMLSASFSNIEAKNGVVSNDLLSFYFNDSRNGIYTEFSSYLCLC